MWQIHFPIVGAGAIGAWWADALMQAGWRVSLVARGATLEALRRDGLRVAQGGRVRVSRPQAGSPGELAPQGKQLRLFIRKDHARVVRVGSHGYET